MKNTKAERIFDNIYRECRIHLKTSNLERNTDGTAIGFSNISEEITCKRTWNAIQKLINRELKKLQLDEELIGTSEYHQLKKDALEMVQSTLNNTIRREEEFKKFLES